jgi:hypothetical protein
MRMLRSVVPLGIGGLNGPAHVGVQVANDVLGVGADFSGDAALLG